MKVIVAGATGTLGSELVPRLIAAGHSVTGLTRSLHGARRLHEMGADAVVADVINAGGLLCAFDRFSADAVIHEATSLTKVPLRHRDLYATNALRLQRTANLLRVAEAVGARRFVTQSFFLGYGYWDHGKALVTEEAPFAQPMRGKFGRHAASLRANEQLVLLAPGIDGIALRYGLFYGPEPTTRKLIEMARRRQLPITNPTGVTSPVHISDAARATVAALERGRGGEAYNIVDDTPLPFAEYVEALAYAAAAPTPFHIPGWMLRPAAYMYALMVTTRIRLSNEKAKRELGWEPSFRSCHEGLVATVKGEAW